MVAVRVSLWVLLSGLAAGCMSSGGRSGSLGGGDGGATVRRDGGAASGGSGADGGSSGGGTFGRVDGGSGTGTGGGGGTTTGTATCGVIVDCLGTCVANDTACEQGCLDTGSSTGQSEFVALNECLNQYCSTASSSQFQACAEQNCSTQLSGCEGLSGGGGGGGGTTTGTATCGGVVDCLGTCAANDSACQQACLDGGSAAGQSQFTSLNDCLNQYCATVSDAQFQTCANNYCASEISGCDGLGGGTGGGGTGGGTLSCSAIVDCINACTAADPACPADCQSQGTTVGQSQLDTLITCLDTYCATVPDAQYNACAQRSCATQINGCQ